MKTKTYAVIAAVCLTIVVCGIVAAVIRSSSNGSLLSVTSSDGTDNNGFYEYASDAADSLDIDVEVGTVTLEQGSSFTVSFNDMGKCDVDCRLDGKTLVIKEDKHGWDWHIGLGTEPECKITVPEGFCASNIKVVLNAGEMNINALKAENSDIQIDAGSVSLNNVQFCNSSFQCGAGEIDFDGSIKGDFDVECGMGSASFNLTGDADDYNFDVECGLGSVSINGDEYGGNTDMTVKGDHPKYKAEIECGLGEIILNTHE